MSLYRFALATSLAVTSLGCQSFGAAQSHAGMSAPLFSPSPTRPLETPSDEPAGGLVVARFDRDSFALEPELDVRRSIALPPSAVDALGPRKPALQHDPTSRDIDASTLLRAPSFVSSNELAGF